MFDLWYMCIINCKLCAFQTSAVVYCESVRGYLISSKNWCVRNPLPLFCQESPVIQTEAVYLLFISAFWIWGSEAFCWTIMKIHSWCFHVCHNKPVFWPKGQSTYTSCENWHSFKTGISSKSWNNTLRKIKSMSSSEKSQNSYFHQLPGISQALFL